VGFESVDYPGDVLGYIMESVDLFGIVVMVRREKTRCGQIVKGGAFLSLHSCVLTSFRKMNLVCVQSYISVDVYRATSSSISN
jgi:hypothetical protein